MFSERVVTGMRTRWDVSPNFITDDKDKQAHQRGGVYGCRGCVVIVRGRRLAKVLRVAFRNETNDGAKSGTFLVWASFGSSHDARDEDEWWGT